MPHEFPQRVATRYDEWGLACDDEQRTAKNQEKNTKKTSTYEFRIKQIREFFTTHFQSFHFSASFLLANSVSTISIY